jgi:glutamate dehydrogenase/leucine dehydrogenase
MENQSHGGNAGNIRTRLVVEGANGPTTPRADNILLERDIPVLPDILANAGGVTVSYYEWLQNQANEQWDYEQVMDRLRARMYKAVDAVFDRWQSFVVGEEESPAGSGLPAGAREIPDYRTVALIIAIERVTRATLMRGIWP